MAQPMASNCIDFMKLSIYKLYVNELIVFNKDSLCIYTHSHTTEQHLGLFTRKKKLFPESKIIAYKIKENININLL